MKKYTNIIALVLVVILFSCGEDEPQQPGEKQIMIESLAKTWTTSLVRIDGLDISGYWHDFTLTIDSDLNYTTSSATEDNLKVWPTSGTLSFPNDNFLKAIERNDGVQITVLEITETSISLSFNIEENSGARVAGITGDWTFEMTN